jgi:hypothetical protein
VGIMELMNSVARWLHRRPHFLAFLCGGLGPGFSLAFTFRPVAMSTSVHRQRVRPPPIGNDIEGRINSRNSQRFSVLNETPILLAACCVLHVFFIFFCLTRFNSRNTLIVPASQRHQFDFQAS